jgi:hypothetical protein
MNNENNDIYFLIKIMKSNGKTKKIMKNNEKQCKVEKRIMRIFDSEN